MRIKLLRNVNEVQNISMKLYADRLESALSAEAQMENVRPGGIEERGPLCAGKKVCNYFIRYASYPRKAANESADVFHIVDHAYAHLLRLLPPERTLVTCHDVMLLKLASREFAPAPLPPKVATQALRYSVSFLRKARHIAAVSQATADDLVRLVGVERSRIGVVRLGVDALFRPPSNGEAERARSRWGLGPGPVLLHVGNNAFYKNIENLLEAFALVRRVRGGAAVTLVKAGKKLTAEQCERTRKLGVTDGIRQLGFVDAEGLQSLYWAADALVFPSVWEGFGWPPLEAMASGTAVICSSAGSLAETVGGAAEIVEPRDPAAIARGIERVLSDSGRREQLRSAGLMRARQFSWAKTAEQTLAMYREIAGQNGRSTARHDHENEQTNILERKRGLM